MIIEFCLVLVCYGSMIKGKRANAVLISEEDWNAISETLHLLSISGMQESIKEGLEQDLTGCSKELDL